MTDKHEALITGAVEMHTAGEKLRTFNNQLDIQVLLAQIRCDDIGGDPFRSRLRTLAFMMGSCLAADLNLEVARQVVDGPFGDVFQPVFLNPPTIVAVPRGGIPMGEGLATFFSTSCLQTNDGKNRMPNEPLIPSPEALSINPVPHVVIADSVVGTGATITRTIGAVSQLVQVDQFSLVCAVASEFGVEELHNAHPHLNIYAACIEPQFKWVDQDGKSVLFVHGIGDVGELVSII